MNKPATLGIAPARGDGMIHVLYVDDNRFDRQLVRDALELEHDGFALTEAASRQDLDAALVGGRFDVVLSDFNILGFEGLEVLAAVNALPRPVPVVIVTGSGSEEVAVTAMKQGAADYVIKTAKHIQRLPATIHAVLERQRLVEEKERAHQLSAELLERLQRTNADLLVAYDATIEGWSRALDLRDKETEGHAQRVTEVAVALARAVGIPEDELVHVRRGALLHDIGKLGVPDQILHKPAPLSDEEWEVMRRHPVHARDLLAPIAFLGPALDIPLYHHERWDGGGYPRGLRGEQIPLIARVFAVVDVWDALRSDRPYRPAMDREVALDYIRSAAGTQLDPTIVEAFLALPP
jgi:putative two-component system response regulator